MLGIQGSSTNTQDNWAIDPDALLIFSLEITRHEPRLFDEILAWLIVNGEWLDTARLRNILKVTERHSGFIKIIGGVFQYVSSHGTQRKWNSLLEFCRQEFERVPAEKEPEPLFWTKEQKRHPRVTEDNADSDFMKFAINRPKIKIQKEAVKIPINFSTNIRFPLRMLFGVGAKSECILYLITHEDGMPKEIADEVGLFWLSVQQALINLSSSGLILKRRKGKKIEYWVPHKKWWEFLTAEPENNFSHPAWLNWIAIYNALSDLWTQLGALASFGDADYLKTSKINANLEMLANEFAHAGIDIPKVPSIELPANEYQMQALEFIGKILRTPKS